MNDDTDAVLSVLAVVELVGTDVTANAAQALLGKCGDQCQAEITALRLAAMVRVLLEAQGFDPDAWCAAYRAAELRACTG